MSCCGGASFHDTDDNGEQKEALKRSTTASHLDQYLKSKKKGDKPGKKQPGMLTEEKQRYVYCTCIYTNRNVEAFTNKFALF